MIDSQTKWQQNLWMWRGSALLGLIGLRVALWMAYVQTAFPKSPLGDPIIYSDLGKIFAAGLEWPIEVVFRAPLYPYVVGWAYKLLGNSPVFVIIFQNIVGIFASMLLLEVLLQHRKRWKGLFWVGLILLLQGGIWTSYEWKLFPVSLAMSLQVLVVATVWLLSTKNSLAINAVYRHLGLILVGMWTACLILLRPNFQLFLPLLLLFALLPSSRKKWGWTACMYWILVPALLISPFMLRNQKMGAGFSLAASSGITFYHGNNPRSKGSYTEVPGVSSDVLFQNQDVLHVARKDGGAETIQEANRYWMEKGVTFLKDNPGATILLLGKKFWGFISPWEAGGDLPFKFEKLRVPLLRWISLANFSFLLFFALLGFAYLWREEPDVVLMLSSLFLVSLATCLIFYMNNRYRVPAWPLLLLPASVGLTRLLGQFRCTFSSKRINSLWKLTAQSAIGLSLLCVTIPITLSPYEAMAGWHNWAVMNAKIGKTDEAIASYKNVLRVNPYHRPSLSNLSRVQLREGNIEESEKLSRRLVVTYADSYMGWTNLSEIALKKHDFATARKNAEAALTLRPKFLLARKALAKATFLLEDYDRACPLLDSLIQGAGRDVLLQSFHLSCKSVWKQPK